MPEAKRRKLSHHPTSVEAANALSLLDFITSYLPSDQDWTTYSQPTTPPTTLTLTLQSSSTLTASELESCFSLIAQSSKSDYERSILGWHPLKKKKEMKLLDLKYLLVRRSPCTCPESLNDPVIGFLSFMPTYEDGVSCCYIYEIHLAPELRGCGLGTHLVGMVESIAGRVGVEEVMLTCFVRNKAARAFYEKMGYAVEEVVEGRKLRQLKSGNKQVDEGGYLIMGKDIVVKAEKDDVESG